MAQEQDLVSNLRKPQQPRGYNNTDNFSAKSIYLLLKDIIHYSKTSKFRSSYRSYFELGVNEWFALCPKEAQYAARFDNFSGTSITV